MDFAEKRRHTRYDRNYKVVCSSFNEPFDKTKIRSCDISLGGLGVFADSPLEPGSELKLEIHGPASDPVLAEGVIRWHKRSHSDPSKYRLGIQFKRVGWTSLKNILPV